MGGWAAFVPDSPESFAGPLKRLFEEADEQSVLQVLKTLHPVFESSPKARAVFGPLLAAADKRFATSAMIHAEMAGLLAVPGAPKSN